MRAQGIHEAEFISLVHSKFGEDAKIRIADFGCGYGGLLRRLYETGLVWSATGCDISGKMCEQARRLNVTQGSEKHINILEESYLDVSVPDGSTDLVISMEALLHVGPERQRRAIQEASRILRPGGWIIFSDIMQQEVVDPVEMQPIYDRIQLSKMGTVSNYKSALEECGFTDFHFDSHSSNVSEHYGSIREVLLEKADSIGISKDYASKMETGLKAWRDCAPKNIEWGFMSKYHVLDFFYSHHLPFLTFHFPFSSGQENEESRVLKRRTGG
jgi:SAM-dependent methyltransferase